jgi:hypothetical protein
VNPSLIHILAINITFFIIISLPIKWIKIPWPIFLHSGIWNKKLLFYNMSDVGNSTGKNCKKNDCITSCYIKQRTQPYLGNIFKNCAPLTLVQATTKAISWSELPNIWTLYFCPYKRKRNEQITYRLASIDAAISINKLLADS